MPGMTYEDFLAAWKKLNQTTNTNQPGFTIESIRFDGFANDHRAEIRFDAVIRTLADGPVDVPLGLVGAILHDEPKFGRIAQSESKPPSNTTPGNDKTAADDHLQNDPEHGGYIAHLVGRAGERRTLAFNLIVPLQRDGSEITLPINCPRALSSQLNLKIDSATSDVRAANGAVLSHELTTDSKTLVKVAGAAGLFRLTWQVSNTDASASSSILNVLGSIRATIDGRGVRSEARLTVRSFGGTFDQLRVRLPAGAQFIQTRTDQSTSQDAKYRVRIEPDNSAPADKGLRRDVAVIELAEKQQGPIGIDLATEQTEGAAEQGQEVNLGGFEVVGAVRQFGDISLTVANDWQARWNAGAFIRQVDPADLDAPLQSSSPTAAFQYDRQPWSLKVRVTPRQSRVHVTPKFELETLADETRLTAHLAYQVFGARAFAFRINLSGWEYTGDPVESAGLVDQDGIEITSDGTLVMPLTQASTRRVEVTFSLRRPAARDLDRLELPLPVPIADSIGTGELIVRAAPDIELLPDLPKSNGLTTAFSPAASSDPDTGTELHFRTLLPNPVFVTDRSARAQEILTNSAAQVELLSNSVDVQQRIEYVARYEPMTEVIFDCPPELVHDIDKVEVSLLRANATVDSKSDEQGTPLHLNLTDETAKESTSDSREIHFMLPQPHIGEFAIRLHYKYPQTAAGATESQISIPLLQPSDGRQAATRATVHVPRGSIATLDTTTDENSWKESQAAEFDRTTSELLVTAETAESYLPLTIRSGRTEPTAVTTIDRVWLQTWLADEVQQDRAVFRFHTSGRQVMVELPPSMLSSEIEILIDRRPAEILSQAPGRVVVRIPESSADREISPPPSPDLHTLELRSRQPRRERLVARHYLTPPQIDGSTALSHVYWQVVLPADRHVVLAPTQLTSASQWQWLGSFWGRQPQMSQADLESWTDSSQQPAPAKSQSQYLYTGLLPLASIEVVTAPRWLIVLGSSAAVLTVSLLLLYLRAAQRKWILAVLACILAAGAIAFPTLALLLAQASTLGLALALLSALLRRLAAGAMRPQVAPIVSQSSQRILTPRSDSRPITPVISAPSTAPTASLHMSDIEQ
jgi:hypothetical protein